MAKASIYFRADGNSKMGLGHVIRSLALAEMLREEFELTFLIRNPLESLRSQILRTCHHLIELPAPKSDLAEASEIAINYLKEGAIIILDGYHFKTAYQERLKAVNSKLVCIDDIYAFHFLADAIINHAPGLSPQVYSKETYSSLHLGLDFSLLRPPFLAAAQQTRKITSLKRVFLCFGGADIHNVSLQVLQFLAQIPEELEQVDVVLGGANVFRNEIRTFAANCSTLQIVPHERLSAQEMADLMTQNDLAIVPASSILYEVTAVKMPVISGFYVDNQINVYNGFNALGMIYGVGNLNEFRDYKTLIREIKQNGWQEQLEAQNIYQKGNSKANFIQLFRRLSNT